MRARELITERIKTLNAIVLREYRRDITIRDQRTKDSIYNRLKTGANEDRNILNHWIAQDKRKLERIAEITAPGSTLLPEVQQMIRYFRALDVDVYLKWLENDKPRGVNPVVINTTVLANAFMTELEAYDPTPNNIYVPWMLREYLKGNIQRLEDMTGYNEKLELYHKSKNRRGFPPEAKDIMRIDASTLTTVVRRFNPEDPMSLAQNLGKYRVIYGDIDVSEDEYGMKVVQQTSNVVVVELLDKTAAIYFGRVFGGFAEWCTAYVPPRTNMFDDYIQSGPILVVVPQQPTHENEKYQLQQSSNQYMDANDDPIDIGWLLNKRFPEIKETVLQFYPMLQDSIKFIDGDKLQELWITLLNIIERFVLEYIRNTKFKDPEWKEYIRRIEKRDGAHSAAKEDTVNNYLKQSNDRYSDIISNIKQMKNWPIDTIRMKLIDQSDRNNDETDYNSVNQLHMLLDDIIFGDEHSEISQMIYYNIDINVHTNSKDVEDSEHGWGTVKTIQNNNNIITVAVKWSRRL